MNLRNALLAGLLALACGPGAVMWAAAETTAPAAVWVIDPAVPGDNLPPAGRSLFDQLFAVDRNGQSSIDLPFPFEACSPVSTPNWRATSAAPCRRPSAS